MVASVEIFYDNGAGPSGATTTGGSPVNVRFKTDDDNTINTTSPIPIPTLAAVRRSYWKHLYLKVIGGSFTQIDNIRFYTDGTLWTGTTLYVGTGSAGTAHLPKKSQHNTSGYDQATGVVGTSGDGLQAGHTLVTAEVDASTYTSAAPLTVSISGIKTGETITSTNDTSDYVVLQLSVASGVGNPGTLTSETIFFKYDEI